MINILYTINVSGKSAKELKNFLKKDYKDTITVNDYDKISPCTLLIRWGNSFTKHDNFRYILNKPECIKMSANKNDMRLNLSKVVNTPKMFDIYDKIDFPVLLRPNNHRASKEIIIIHNENELHRYYTNQQIIQYVGHNRTDYRVFLWLGSAIRIYKWVKIKTDASLVVRNDFNGWRMVWVNYSKGNKQLLDKIINAAETAAKHINLDICAIDIGVKHTTNVSNDDIFVYETNTSPYLSPVRANIYSKLILEFLNNRDKQ